MLVNLEKHARQKYFRLFKCSSTCQGLKKFLGLSVSTSRSHFGLKIECLTLELRGKSGLELEAKRLGLGPQCLVYIPEPKVRK